jgi:hypothetical protein
MATYIQGVQGYIPQIQPFQPDLNFYKGVMDVKESQYKAGYDKVSNMYGQLLNSELTRGVNNERRSKFFDQITNDIQKMAGVDLSLEQNVDAAYQIFQPLIDDKNVIKDMAWTKNFNREFQRSESFRNCTDEKKCGGKWWEDGVRAMNYQRMDFAKATDDQALGFTNVKYTPYVNVTEKATKLAKEMGFNVQSVTWSPDGRYIVTTKNGPAMTVSLTNYFNSVFGNDPQVQELYKTKAYLQRKDYAYGNAEQYGSEDAAEQAYLTETMNYIEQQQNQLKQEAEDEANQLQLKTNIIEKKQANGEVDLDNPDDELARAYEQLRNETGVINSVLDQHTNTLSLIDKSTLLRADLETMRWRVDQAVAGSLLNQELYTAADSYAMLNMEQKIEADPYAKASFENSLAMGRMYAKHELDMQMVEYKVAMGLVEDVYGNPKTGSGKMTKQAYLSGGGNNILNQQSQPWANNSAGSYQVSQTMPGSSAEVNLYNANVERTTEALTGTDIASTSLLSNMYNHYTGIMRSQPGTDEAKLAQQELVNIVGKNNIDYAIQKGIIDKNFNIIDNYQFSSFVESNRDNLMNAAGKSLNDNKYFLFDQTNDFEAATFSDLKDSQDQYNTLKTVADRYTDLNKQYVNEVKNTFLAKSYSSQHDSMPGILRWGSNLFKDTKLDFISKVIDFGYFSSPYAALNQIKQNMVDAPSKKNREMFINQMFEKDGYTFKSKDQFVADSFNAYKQNTSQLGINIDRTAKFRNSPWDLLRLTAPGAIISGIESVFSTESGDIKKYLGNVYDDMKKTYITEYNSGRLASYNQGTHQYAQAMEAMVDGADFQNPVFHDYVSIMQNFNTVANEEGVKVLKGSNWTQKNFGDAETNTQSRMLMDYLNTDMINTTFKFDDRDRPMVRMINQGIAANDPNMTAYTFQVNDSYILANAGTDKKPGALSGLVSDGKVKKDANTFTVFIPKPLANNSYVYNLENGPYQTLLNETGSVNYSMSDVLDINVKKQGAQTKTTLNWKHFNINTGKWDIHSEERPYNDGSNLDEWLSSFKYDKKLGPIVKGIRDANIYNQIAYKQRNM